MYVSQKARKPSVSVASKLAGPWRAQMRARLVSGNGVSLVYKVRKFDVISCDAADQLPSAQRRQCVAVRGTGELARACCSSCQSGVVALAAA